MQMIHSLDVIQTAMVSVITSVAPFYEPSAPVHAVHLLTSKTEFLPTQSTTILTQELLQAPKVESSKLPHKLMSHRFRSTSLDEHDPSSPESGKELGNSTGSDGDSNDGLISKLAGEAGRPWRGGYDLELELSWHSR